MFIASVLLSFCPSVLLSFCPSVLLSFCPSETKMWSFENKIWWWFRQWGVREADPKKLKVRSVAPWIVDSRGFLISMGCSIASKIPMNDQNPWKFTFYMDFFESVFFPGFFHRDKICNPSHHAQYKCNMSASSTEEKDSWTEELKGMLIQVTTRPTRDFPSYG